MKIPIQTAIDKYETQLKKISNEIINKVLFKSLKTSFRTKGTLITVKGNQIDLKTSLCSFSYCRNYNNSLPEVWVNYDKCTEYFYLNKIEKYLSLESFSKEMWDLTKFHYPSSIKYPYIALYAWGFEVEKIKEENE